MIGIDSDRLILPPDLKGNINGRHTLDEGLLGPYRSEIGHGGSSRFIGLHIMRSHWEYYARYLKTFRKVGNTSELAQVSMGSVLMDDPNFGTVLEDDYDNSPLYTDRILQQIIETGCTLTEPASVTFVPGHGENLQLLAGAACHGGRPIQLTNSRSRHSYGSTAPFEASVRIS